MENKRIVLFRGQTRRQGELVNMMGEQLSSNWVYGGVGQGEGDFSIIYQVKPEIQKFTVYTDTLGQFVGHVDKYRRNIFCGDVLKCGLSEEVGEVKWCSEHSGFYVDVHYECGAIPKRTGFTKFYAENCEIIGNIFDNPEFLSRLN